jgi:hypothetical protein
VWVAVIVLVLLVLGLPYLMPNKAERAATTIQPGMQHWLVDRQVGRCAERYPRRDGHPSLKGVGVGTIRYTFLDGSVLVVSTERRAEDVSKSHLVTSVETFPAPPFDPIKNLLCNLTRYFPWL